MELELHNKLNINQRKAFNTVYFFAKRLIDKVAQRNWKLEIWLEEENAQDPVISCGLALKRPKTGTIYAKKFAGSLNQAVKHGVQVIEKNLSKDKEAWRDYKGLPRVS